MYTPDDNAKLLLKLAQGIVQATSAIAPHNQELATQAINIYMELWRANGVLSAIKEIQDIALKISKGEDALELPLATCLTMIDLRKGFLATFDELVTELTKITPQIENIFQFAREERAKSEEIH